MNEEENGAQDKTLEKDQSLDKEHNDGRIKPVDEDRQVVTDSTETESEGIDGETKEKFTSSIEAQETKPTDDDNASTTDSNIGDSGSTTVETPQENATATQEEKTDSQVVESEEEKKIPDDFDELLEGALFASGKPLSMEKMESVFGYPAVEIRACLRGIIKKLEDTKSSLRVEEVSKDTYVLCLASEYEDLVKPLIKSTKSEKGIFTNPAVMDIVTNIAYRQPITISLLGKIISDKIDIPTQRKIIADLIEQGYVEKIEKGRSVRLKVTTKFMDTFGFNHDSRKMKLQILWRLKRGK
ncbi:MAG: SMC-Scp complex subunit ScpB [Candidatus Hodarchaeales archaeon]